MRVLFATLLCVLFAFAAFEPVLAHCDADDAADGACCYCLCSQALDAPDIALQTDFPTVIVEPARPTVVRFESLTFSPPSPPPRA